MSVLTKRAPSFFNPIRTAGWSVVGLILLTPLAAMQFTSEVAGTGRTSCSPPSC